MNLRSSDRRFSGTGHSKPMFWALLNFDGTRDVRFERVVTG